MDNTDGTVTDCRTGLIWLKDADCRDSLVPGIDKSLGRLNWYDALQWVPALSNGHCGLNDGSNPGDWRLPTQTEFMAMVASARKQGFTSPALTNGAGTSKWTNGDIFYNVQYGDYWSSTTLQGNPTAARYINLINGNSQAFFKNIAADFVWPVRGGQSGEFGSITIQ